MEPALASGGRVLVRRTRRAPRGQGVVLRVAGGAGPGVPPAGQDDLLLKRVVAVQGDTLPAGWAYPDVAELAGTRVPRGSLVVLGDNRPTSWDSRHYGYVSRDRLVGVVVRRMPARERKRRVRHALPSSFNL
jgi:signal peptidase I